MPVHLPLMESALFETWHAVLNVAGLIILGTGLLVAGGVVIWRGRRSR